MRHLTLLASAAALVLAAPAFAQDVPAAPPATAQAAPATPAPTAPAPQTPEELAMNAEVQSFQTTIQTMSQEIQAALVGASGDTARATADAEVIIARHSPSIDAFATRLETFMTERAATEPEPQRAEMLAAAAEATTEIRSIPSQMRAGVQQAMTAAAAAPAPAPAPAASAPTAPATPQ